MKRICPTAPTPRRRLVTSAELAAEFRSGALRPTADVAGDIDDVVVLAKAIAVVQRIRARRRKLDCLAKRIELARLLDGLRKLCGERKERGL